MKTFSARVLGEVFSKPSLGGNQSEVSKVSTEDKEHLELLRKYVSAKQNKRGSKAKELLLHASEERRKRHSKRMKVLQAAADKSVNPLHISNKKKSGETEAIKEEKSRLLQLLTGQQVEDSKQGLHTKLPESKRKRRRGHKTNEPVDIRIVEQESFNDKYSQAVREVEGDYTERNLWVLKKMQEADRTVHKSIYEELGIDRKRKKKRRRVLDT